MIVAFTGRLVLATAGLFMVVITWLVFQVTSFFAPDLVAVADPKWLWTLVVAGLYGLVSIVLDAVLGLSRPSLDVEGRGKFICASDSSHAALTNIKSLAFYTLYVHSHFSTLIIFIPYIAIS